MKKRQVDVLNGRGQFLARYTITLADRENPDIGVDDKVTFQWRALDRAVADRLGEFEGLIARVIEETASATTSLAA